MLRGLVNIIIEINIYLAEIITEWKRLGQGLTRSVRWHVNRSLVGPAWGWMTAPA
eukprot:SAG25_NODE_3818_length_959_cov_1.186047_1_plen_54_part_01